MIKVLIVDDSALIRKILTDLLESDNDINVIGTARNGVEALEKIAKLQPDIVTLDVEMPLMDGLTTLKHIVNQYKIPVIMISSLTSEGAELTLKALDEGAFDFLPKPSNIFNINQSHIRQEIIDKVKAGVRAKQCVRLQHLESKQPATIRKSQNFTSQEFNNIIVIGTSTGGPRALQQILPLIPGDINGSFLIVQHMPPKFTKSLADRLDYISNIRIKEAEDGDIVTKGVAYIAPGDYHMTVEKNRGQLRIGLNQEPQVMGLRPTVDKLMDSVANVKGYKKTGVILTGMGSDGSSGIKKMKESGSFTIAQDEESSIVYGMPKSAISTNCIDEVLPLDKIADKIINIVGV